MTTETLKQLAQRAHDDFHEHHWGTFTTELTGTADMAGVGERLVFFTNGHTHRLTAFLRRLKDHEIHELARASYADGWTVAVLLTATPDQEAVVDETWGDGVIVGPQMN